ncbi:ICMT-domain-containing protein [Rhizopogon vinicolor AM-OR11-026]|uniref:Protein-S-isoprenylcysteine O-methyltransferase n=1 Tax=Rhizopogon vinicolor AM-OR11-026 TaxID=1314800 RepID=A0A1B7NF00_9AGAM|nr:ICMT-domain-containing protein [Rhizopogon vinicolor AM-OR11-026]
MSLLKIPLILSSAAAMQVSLTPPNHSSSSEVIRNPISERIMLRLIKYGLFFAKGLYWVISVTEIAVIASRATGSSTLHSIIQRAVGPLLGMIQDMPITSHFLFGTALVVTGGLFRWWCFRTLGRFFTFEVSVRKEHQLVKTGPYAIVRHPAYTGFDLQLIGVLILHGSRTSWLRDSGVLETIPGLKLFVLLWLVEGTTTAISLLLRISQEEQVVKSHFGDEWKRWAKEVRYRLIPGIY